MDSKAKSTYPSTCWYRFLRFMLARSGNDVRGEHIPGRAAQSNDIGVTLL
jgi:hypothetical protein